MQYDDYFDTEYLVLLCFIFYEAIWCLTEIEHYHQPRMEDVCPCTGFMELKFPAWQYLSDSITTYLGLFHQSGVTRTLSREHDIFLI